MTHRVSPSQHRFPQNPFSPPKKGADSSGDLDSGWKNKLGLTHTEGMSFCTALKPLLENFPVRDFFFDALR